MDFGSARSALKSIERRDGTAESDCALAQETLTILEQQPESDGDARHTGAQSWLACFFCRALPDAFVIDSSAIKSPRFAPNHDVGNGRRWVLSV